jgi:hypothetical protein
VRYAHALGDLATFLEKLASIRSSAEALRTNVWLPDKWKRAEAGRLHLRLGALCGSVNLSLIILPPVEAAAETTPDALPDAIVQYCSHVLELVADAAGKTQKNATKSGESAEDLREAECSAEQRVETATVQSEEQPAPQSREELDESRAPDREEAKATERPKRTREDELRCALSESGHKIALRALTNFAQTADDVRELAAKPDQDDTWTQLPEVLIGGSRRLLRFLEPAKVYVSSVLDRELAAERSHLAWDPAEMIFAAVSYGWAGGGRGHDERSWENERLAQAAETLKKHIDEKGRFETGRPFFTKTGGYVLTATGGETRSPSWSVAFPRSRSMCQQLQGCWPSSSGFGWNPSKLLNGERVGCMRRVSHRGGGPSGSLVSQSKPWIESIRCWTRASTK